MRRAPITRNAARLHIAEGASAQYNVPEGVTRHDERWLVEAILELCLTIDDASTLVAQAIDRVGDKLDIIEKRIKNVEAAIDSFEGGKK